MQKDNSIDGPGVVPRGQKLTLLQLVNMPRKMRRLIGKSYGVKIPGVQDIISKTKDNVIDKIDDKK